MWQVINHTPYAAECNWVRDKHGAHDWVVAVKASFHVGPGGALRLTDVQPPPLLAPEYHGEAGASSLRNDADLGPLKPATDVWVIGHACAPRGRPVTELPVSLRFAGMDKTLLVRGENFLVVGVTGLRTTVPRPFVRMPLIYERAYGGADTSMSDPRSHRIDVRNPVGVGFVSGTERREDSPGPNVVYPGRDIAGAGPAGFGAIASYWSPRAELAGTFDERWMSGRRALRALLAARPACPRPPPWRHRHRAGAHDPRRAHAVCDPAVAVVVPNSVRFPRPRAHSGARQRSDRG